MLKSKKKSKLRVSVLIIMQFLQIFNILHLKALLFSLSLMNYLFKVDIHIWNYLCILLGLKHEQIILVLMHLYLCNTNMLDFPVHGLIKFLSDVNVLYILYIHMYIYIGYLWEHNLNSDSGSPVMGRFDMLQ